MDNHVEVAIVIDIGQDGVHTGCLCARSAEPDCGSIHLSRVKLPRRQDSHPKDSIAFGVEWV